MVFNISAFLYCWNLISITGALSKVP